MPLRAERTILSQGAESPCPRAQIGSGLLGFVVSEHPEHESRCFFVVRTDGTKVSAPHRVAALQMLAPLRPLSNQSESPPPHLPSRLISRTESAQKSCCQRERLSS